jgi:hypothetical protein
MGGYFSGRTGGGPVAEDCLNLDLAQCIRDRTIRPGQHVSDSITWTLARTGKLIASHEGIPGPPRASLSGIVRPRPQDLKGTD